MGGRLLPVHGEAEGGGDDRDRQQEQANEQVLGADELRHAHISES